MDINKILKDAQNMNASDVHITVNFNPIFRVNGNLVTYGEKCLGFEDNLNLVKQLVTDKQYEKLEEQGEIDLSYSQCGLGRFRVNIYKQRGTFGIAIRNVAMKIPSINELGLPDLLKDLASKKRGLVLITGPTGSGKTTTLASMIDYINSQKCLNILTLEDPIEYLHKHNKSIVNQREIGTDSKSFANALRASLRQDPDVILVGEMRDLETISIALTAAETGHLVLSTLHTVGAANTIDRIIDVFPHGQREQILTQLSLVIEGVVSQQLIPRVDKIGRVVAIETMIATNAIRNIIRDGKTYQIANTIQTGAKYGMKSMDSSIVNLYERAIISCESVINYSIDKDLACKLAGIKEY